MILNVYLPQNSPAYAVHASVDDAVGREDRSETFEVLSTIELVKVGRTTYRFRSPARGTFIPAKVNRNGQFWVDGFSPLICGRGATIEKSRRAWEENLHQQFQTLYSMCEWEMSTEQAQLWTVLTRWIDVDLYRNTTPIAGREIGKILSMRPGHYAIRWIDGRKESFRLHQMPPTFAAYKPGMWIEADVERDPMSGRLKKVLHSTHIRKFDEPSKAELQAEERSWGTTAELPAATL